jgi:hypothetical protein
MPSRSSTRSGTQRALWLLILPGSSCPVAMGRPTDYSMANFLWCTTKPTNSLSFLQGGQVERIQYPIQICRRLAAILQESTLLYPTSRRHFDHFAVGLLQRIQA